MTILNKTEQKLIDRLESSARGICEVVGIRESRSARALLEKGVIAKFQPIIDKEIRRGKTFVYFGGAIFSHKAL